MYVIFNVHLLVNTCFIQRTEHVLIELDISAIEEYVIIMYQLRIDYILF